MLDLWDFLGVLYICVELCDSVTARASLEDCPLSCGLPRGLVCPRSWVLPYAPCCVVLALKTLFVASRLSVLRSDLPLSFCDIER